MSARRRYRGRRRSTNLAGFVVCLVFVLAVFVFLDANVFVVKRIMVSGNRTISDADIIEISGLRFGERMMSIDFDAIRDNFKREGTVELAGISRQWPDGVSIEIAQKSVAAVVQHLGTAILVDEEVNVMRVVSDIPSINVPVITGVGIISSAVGNKLGTVKARQSSDIADILRCLIDWGMLESVSEINLSKQDDVYLVTRGGMIVVLGSTSELDDKVMWMKNVVAQLAADGVNRGEIDVSSGKMAIYSQIE